MQIISLKSHILYFSIFFIIFYVEILKFAGIKIAILWKLILIVYIFLYIFRDNSKQTIKNFVFFGYLYSLKNFITISSFTNLIPALTEAIKSSYIVLLFHFFILLNKHRNINIYSLLVYISTYIILSSIPFLLNIIAPLGNGYNLDIFGIDAHGFVGIFQVASSAAITIAFAIIILIYHLIHVAQGRNKIFFFLLIILGLWIEIQTYARTGFAVVFVGGGFLLLYKKSFKFYLKLLVPLTALFFILIYYYNSSKVLQMRMAGTNIYMKKSKTETYGGSGRLVFGYYAIDNWYSTDFAGIFIGLGTELAKDMMKEDVGLRIYAHNGYIDVLQFNGIIGAMIYLFFLFFLIKYIFDNRFNKYYKLTIAVLFGYLISMLFQGEHYFLADFIFALTLSLLNSNQEIKGDKQ